MKLQSKPLCFAAAFAVSNMAAAQDTATDPNADLARLKAEEELRKLQFENDKAEREEKEARLKAIADSFPTSPTSGSTEVKTGAGQMEANALTAVAINALADDIARDSRAAARASSGAPLTALQPCLILPETRAAGTNAPVPVLLLSGDEKLTFGHWEQFRFRACHLDEEFRRTKKAAREALGIADDEGGGVAAFGTAVTVASKLLQLVTPDWEIGGITVTASDKALMAAVARQYINGSPTTPIYWGSQISKLGGGSAVFGALSTLNKHDLDAGGLIGKLKPNLSKAQKALDAIKKKNGYTTAAEAEVEKWADPTTALTAAKGSYVALLQHLNGKPGEALLPINQVINEAAAADLLGASGLALNVDVETSGGGYYKRKVIWDALGIGGPPFYVTGGVVVNYLAVRPSDQRVLAAGLFSCSAGYLKINQAASRTNTGSLANNTGCQPVALKTSTGASGPDK